MRKPAYSVTRSAITASSRYRRRVGDSRVWSALIVLLCFAPVLAQNQAEDPASPLAGLTVIAYGDQEIDFATGITTLPEGGEVIDRESGITLVAQVIRYREGDFIEAEVVQVSGAFGVANAASVRVDLTAATLEASGGVTLERDDLGLSAQSLHYFVEDGVLRFDGPVAGIGTTFEAATVILDARSGVLLLTGPYSYQDAMFELRSSREGALLALTPSEVDEHSLEASTTVPPELLERLGSYLP